ncbi:Lysophospholipase L1 [Mucilaginibacter pineti]|uniref:Lysophospholipase L1 n=1 Tax=Mucilaginibacter pineti TaxID=1391627 RepID=A0A1G7EU69_9SPHI|nr:SGNH/GDSL hydrolase family protein [Mucilaginibacter pineti]SDE67141.1 Lysophospholipase L1 [Mucilaginibacter pineti]
MAIIDDFYIDDVIKSTGPFNAALNKTQGVKLRELVKLLRDGLQQEIDEHAGAVGPTGPQGPKGDTGPQGPPGPAGSGGGVSGLNPKQIAFGRSDGTIEQNDSLQYDAATKTLTNAALLSAEKSIVGIGDSITQQYAASSIDKCFFSLLAGMLGLNPVNLGGSGGTAGGFDRSLIPTYNAVIHQYITIEFGTNDSEGTGPGGYDTVATFTPAYQQLITDIHGKGWPYSAMYLLSIPGVYNSGLDSPPSPLAIQFNTVMSNTATSVGATYIDIWTPLRTAYFKPVGSFNADYHHPNDAGHYMIAKAIAAVINPLFKSDGQGLIIDKLAEVQSLKIRRTNVSVDDGNKLLVVDAEGNVLVATILQDMQRTKRLSMDGALVQTGAHKPAGETTYSPAVYDPIKDVVLYADSRILSAPDRNSCNYIKVNDIADGKMKFMIENSAGGWSFISNHSDGTNKYEHFFVEISTGKAYFNGERIVIDTVANTIRSKSQDNASDLSLSLGTSYLGSFWIQINNDAGGIKERLGGILTQIIYNNGDRVFQKDGPFTHETSSMHSVNSITQGSIPWPRMTTAQRTAITSPVEALSVWDTDVHKLFCYDGTTWQAAW